MNIFEDDKKYFIVSEYCDGPDIFSKAINHKKLSEWEVAKIIGQILKLLAIYHN